MALPPGFRFYPTDDELILHYLKQKIADGRFSRLETDLPSMPADEVKMGEEDRFFFCRKDRKYPTGMRTNRATITGYWKEKCKDKEIFRGNRVLTGMKKRLVFHTGSAAIEHQTGVDVSTGDMKRIAADDGRHGDGDQNEPDRFRCDRRRRPPLALRNKQWEPAHDDDDGFNMATPKEEYSLHCAVRAPEPSVRSPTSEWATCMKIIHGFASAHKRLDSSLIQPIHHGDLKPGKILLDEKSENRLSEFGLSRLYIKVPTENRPLGAEFSGKPSGKRGIQTKIGSHMARRRRYLSVHHPLIQMMTSARKLSGDMLRSWVRSTTKSIIGMPETSAKTKYEISHAGHVSEGIVRKHFGIRSELIVNKSQQHSGPHSCQADGSKMAVNTKTSASWIVATAAPHHATGNRSLLSGFIMEHDDQFVHAVNRVPMKVLARGAVVTDTLILPDVWFVPGLTENLVSVSQLAELDHSIGFGRGECCIRSARDAKIVGKGRLQKGGHYVLDYLKVPLAI